MAVYHSDDCGETRKYHFRPIRSRKIKFSVQAERDVAICLSKDDDNDNDNMYEIFIGCWGGPESGIRKGQTDDVLRVDTPDILCADEFRSFWVKAGGGKIKVGRRGELCPFMIYEDEDRLQGLKYYGFSTGWGAEGDWMFPDGEDESSSSSSSAVSSSDSEAEELNSMEIRPIMYKRPARWVPATGGYLPRHPVSGGEGENGSVYVGMAEHEGGHILGMVSIDENLCYIPWGGEAIAKEDYFVLGNPGSVELAWKAGSAGSIPSGALQGGFTEDNEPLYIGRVCVDGVVSCGKVQPSHQVCYVPYNGAEHKHRDYEVLCVQGIPCRIKV